jgi:hypothetical protein
MNAKIGESTGAKFYGKDVRTVSVPQDSGAQAGQQFDLGVVKYVLLQEVGTDDETKMTKFLCYEAHTAEEEYHIKRKLIARSRR